MSRLPIIAVLIAALSGCSSAGYYLHAIGGQLDIMGRARPIAEMLEPATDADAPVAVDSSTRQRLTRALRIRDFATRELHLPDNGSYTDYVALDRDAVAWNVVAAPEFSLDPRRWCYPFAGCVPYRGFFSLDRARSFARELRDTGEDVRIAVVAGFSTLGWFRDPVLSTQLQRDADDLAAVIFHELAHQALYVAGDTTFNESFATVVEQIGIRQWVQREGNPERFTKWKHNQQMQRSFEKFLRHYRADLEAVYRSGTGADFMRSEKKRIFAAMQSAYPAWRTQWNNSPRFDGWMAQDLNNAHLAGVDLYHRHVAAFEELYRQNGNQLGEFIRAARILGELPRTERDRRLAALAGEQSAGP